MVAMVGLRATMGGVSESGPSPGELKKTASFAGAYDDWGEEKWEDGEWGDEAWGSGYDDTGWPDPMAMGAMGYYEGYDGEYGGDWGVEIEVDLYTMIFALDNALDPKELYEGFELDEKSLVFDLNDSDVEELAPGSVRPLKIHPEPTTSAQPSPQRGEASTPGRQRADSDSAVGPLQLSPRQRSSLAALGGDLGEGPADVEAASPGSQSPKIVISNSQLEHLKQKMQALKQRRTATTSLSNSNEDDTRPPPSPPEASLSLSPPEKNQTRNTPASPVMKPALKNCPGRHGLQAFTTPDDGWWCSNCQREHPKETIFYGCRTCDYDECKNCYFREVKARGEKAKEERNASPPAVPSSSNRVVPGSARQASSPPASARPERRSAPASSTQKSARNDSPPPRKGSTRAVSPGSPPSAPRRDPPSEEVKERRKRETPESPSSRRVAAESPPARRSSRQSPEPQRRRTESSSKRKSVDESTSKRNESTSKRSEAASKRTESSKRLASDRRKSSPVRDDSSDDASNSEDVRPTKRSAMSAASRSERADRGKSSRQTSSPSRPSDKSKDEASARNSAASARPRVNAEPPGRNQNRPAGRAAGGDYGNNLLQRVLRAAGQQQGPGRSLRGSPNDKGSAVKAQDFGGGGSRAALVPAKDGDSDRGSKGSQKNSERERNRRQDDEVQRGPPAGIRKALDELTGDREGRKSRRI